MKVSELVEEKMTNICASAAQVSQLILLVHCFHYLGLTFQRKVLITQQVQMK
jgi:hypothetical protein